MEERALRAEERAEDPRLPPLPEAKRLARYLASRLPGATEVSVGPVERIPHGAAREHYRFDAAWREGGRWRRQPLILLRDHEIPEELTALYEDVGGSSLVLWVLGRGDRDREFRILRFLEGTGVPAPRARWVELTGEWLERPFTIHERIPGMVAPSFTLLGIETAAQRAEIARQFVEILAAIHHADWQGGGLGALGVPPTGTRDYSDLVIETLDRRLVVACPERPAVVDRTLAWLRQRRPLLEEVALCHGDYKTDNLIFEGDRIQAILDWEFAHLGDPLEDVGWACMGLHASEGRCMGLLPREELLAAYARASGRPLCAERVRFWEVAGTLRMTSFGYSMLEGSRRREAEPGAVDAAEAAAARAFLASMVHRLVDDLARLVGEEAEGGA